MNNKYDYARERITNYIYIIEISTIKPRIVDAYAHLTYTCVLYTFRGNYSKSTQPRDKNNFNFLNKEFILARI